MSLLALRPRDFPDSVSRIVALFSLGLTACVTDRAVAPIAPVRGAAQQQYRAMAFTADVDARTGRIVISSPASAPRIGPTLSIEGAQQPALSLLGGDAVRLLPSNYRASAVGAFAPNKIRVTFDVSIENKLPGVAMTTPTWPIPPAPGVLLFPLDYVVTTSAGGVTGGDGNAVIVEQPSLGGVTPSIDWDGIGTPGSGAPFNFFNDESCAAIASNDCFRWESFDTSIQPFTASDTRTVGFDIDASVAQFRARMIVAADFSSSLVVGTVAGRITSSVDGSPIAGARVRTSSGAVTRTDSAGRYTLRSLPGSLAVSNLYIGCSAPSPSFVFTTEPPVVLDVVATCPRPVAPGYQLSVQWSARADGKIEADVRLDMRTLNWPAIPDVTSIDGPGDPVTEVEMMLVWEQTQLSFVSANLQLDAPSLIPFTTFLTSPGSLNFSAINPNAPQTGNVQIAKLTFARAPGALTGASLIATIAPVKAFASGSDIRGYIVPVPVPFVFPQLPAP